MKVEQNWKSKSLENLEKDFWSKSDFESNLVKKCHELRKVPLTEFEVEDLRLMISQEIGLKYLVPMTMEVLSDNILAEGDFYEGDLLKAVCSVDSKHWIDHTDNLKELKALIERNSTLITDEMGEKEYKKLLNS